MENCNEQHAYAQQLHPPRQAELARLQPSYAEDVRNILKRLQEDHEAGLEVLRKRLAEHCGDLATMQEVQEKQVRCDGDEHQMIIIPGLSGHSGQGTRRRQLPDRTWLIAASRGAK